MVADFSCMIRCKRLFCSLRFFPSVFLHVFIMILRRVDFNRDELLSFKAVQRFEPESLTIVYTNKRG